MMRTTVLRTLALGAGIALLATACSSGDAGDDSTDGASGDTDDHLVAQLQHRRRQGLLRQGRRRLRGRQPGRDHRGQRRCSTRTCSPSSTPRSRAATPPDVFHGAGRRRAGRPGRGGPDQGHHRGGRGHDRARSAAPSPAGRWTTRRTACRSPSASSASGTTRPSSSRPASPSRPTTLDELNDGRRQAQGRRHRARSPSAPATSGRPRTTGTTSRCASARRTS